MERGIRDHNNKSATFFNEQYGVPTLKGSKHRVFFQNAEGNINMGVLFNDPDVEMKEIYWFNTLAQEMVKSLQNDEGLISIDEELKTQSCYVELHRNGFKSTDKP